SPALPAQHDQAGPFLLGKGGHRGHPARKERLGAGDDVGGCEGGHGFERHGFSVCHSDRRGLQKRQTGLSGWHFFRVRQLPVTSCRGGPLWPPVKKTTLNE